MIDDVELRDIFKAASEEHLQNLDNGLLHLEKYPNDQVALEALMREAHSLKGDANMLGVKDIGTLAHQIEHILSQLQQQELCFSQELGDRLAEGMLAIRQLVHEAITGEDLGVDTFRVLSVLMGGRRDRTQSDTPPEAVVVTHSLETRTAYVENVANSSNNVSEDVPQHSSFNHLDNNEIASEPTDADVAALNDPGVFDGANTPSQDIPVALGSLVETLVEPICPPEERSDLVSSRPLNQSLNNTKLVSKEQHYRIDSIRVKTQSLDSLMTQASELTVTKIRITHRLAEIEAIANEVEEWSRELFSHHRYELPTQGVHSSESATSRVEAHLEQLGRLIAGLRTAFTEDTTRLEHLSQQLEEEIRTLRLLPLSTIFNVFPRMVRDLARQEKKQVELVIEGGETCADKRILEDMKDPLMHLLRNAIDHGVELPSDRLQQGKPATATLSLRSYQTATHIIIEVQDDGRGLDLQRIQQTALKRGLLRADELASMSPHQIESLIFAPGFSTAPLVTEVSGRGVGLDVVQTNIAKLKGSIQVESSPNQGCLFRIQLGLTLATVHVLIVLIQETPYAIPVEFVVTACQVKPEDIFTLEGRDTIAWQQQPLSVARLGDLLELSSSTSSKPSKSHNLSTQLTCIILQVGLHRFGLFVDDLLDEQNVVIKPQAALLKRVRNVAGATILGTGEVCIVLNPEDLMKSMRRHSVPIPTHERMPLIAPKPTVLLVEDSIATRTQEKRMLESAGYKVVTAIDGNDGFSKLQTQAVDAVISDVQMPNLDGLQLTAKVRQLHQYDEIPIILITSLASDEDKRRGAEAGANAYITKNTLTQQMLVETLERLI